MPSVAVGEKQNENKNWGSFMKNITLGDHRHCCPHGYTCDATSGTCRRKSEELKDVPCPDGRHDYFLLLAIICCINLGSSACPDGLIRFIFI